MVKERRINRPSHIKTLMQEQINVLRDTDDIDPVKRAKAIAYLSNTALSAYREAETLDKLEAIEKRLNQLEGNEL